MIDVYVSLALAARPPVKPTTFNCHVTILSQAAAFSADVAVTQIVTSQWTLQPPTPFSWLPDGIVSLLPDNVISFPWQPRYNFMLISRLENRTAVRKMDSWNLIFFFLYFFCVSGAQFAAGNNWNIFPWVMSVLEKRKEGRNCGVVRWLWVQWRGEFGFLKKKFGVSENIFEGIEPLL